MIAEGNQRLAGVTVVAEVLCQRRLREDRPEVEEHPRPVEDDDSSDCEQLGPRNPPSLQHTEQSESEAEKRSFWPAEETRRSKEGRQKSPFVGCGCEEKKTDEERTLHADDARIVCVPAESEEGARHSSEMNLCSAC